MIISAKLIKKPRKPWYCDDCGKWSGVLKLKPYIRLYGAAFDNDPKTILKICEACAWRDINRDSPQTRKIRVALGLDAIPPTVIPEQSAERYVEKYGGQLVDESAVTNELTI